jgi:plastocyanin
VQDEQPLAIVKCCSSLHHQLTGRKGKCMRKSLIVFAIVVVLGLLASSVFVITRGQSTRSHYNAATPSQAHAEAGPTITIDNFSFTSATLTVAVGTKVTWVNHDDVPHTVVSTEQKFKSHALDTDESFSFTFAEPGSYPYFCSLHPKMVGKVIVEGERGDSN